VKTVRIKADLSSQTERDLEDVARIRRALQLDLDRLRETAKLLARFRSHLAKGGFEAIEVDRDRYAAARAGDCRVAIRLSKPLGKLAAAIRARYRQIHTLKKLAHGASV